jgi:hypothetical protein
MINFRPPTSGTTGGTYREARHDSLNFESCGGERHSPDDTTLEPFGRIYHFLASAAAKLTARTK